MSEAAPEDGPVASPPLLAPLSSSSSSAAAFLARRERVAASPLFAALLGLLLLLEGLVAAAAATFFSRRLLSWDAARPLLTAAAQAAWFRARVLPTVGGFCSFDLAFVPSRRALLFGAGLAAVALYNRAELSFANVWRNDADGLDWARAAQYVLASPAQEELLFRGALFLPMVCGNKGRVGALLAALCSGLLFALFHLGNVSLSRRYRLLQLLFSLACGTCYAASLLRERSFCQTIALHAANNLLAAATPAALLERSLADAAVGPPLLAVLLLHLLLAF